MRRKVEPELLVGASDIALRLGFRSVQGVLWHSRRDPGFPVPVTSIGRHTRNPTRVWYWPDVEEWARRKLPARVTDESSPE